MNRHLKIQTTGRFFFQIISFIFALAVISCGDESDDNNGGNLVPERVIYMWVSATKTDGNIGGYSGADIICQREGEKMTFPTRVVSHKAILSGSRQDAKDLFDSDIPVKRPDYTEIIDRYADFFNPSKDLKNSVETSEIDYFTGIDTVGSPSDSRGSCDDWNSVASRNGGRYGKSNRIGSARYSYASGANCHIDHSLLCASH